MALILEDGTGVAGADAYDPVADADAWLTARGMLVFAALSSADQEPHMRKAVEHVEALAADGLTGYKRFITEGEIQPLNYPRLGAYYLDGGVIGTAEIPLAYREAIYVACERSAEGTLESSLPTGIKRERATSSGSEIEYESSAGLSYPHADISRRIARVSRRPGEWRAA